MGSALDSARTISAAQVAQFRNEASSEIIILAVEVVVAHHCHKAWASLAVADAGTVPFP